MLAGKRLVLVADQPAIDRVGQDLVDLAAAEGATALFPATRKEPVL